MTPAPFESDATRAPERVAAIAAALRSWRRELSTLGGPNTLLWSSGAREQPSGALDLTTAHPSGVSMLLAGRPTRLSDLVRERAAFAEARGRAARIRERVIELASERGIETGFLVAGMATWDHPGAATPPLAPVLLRSCALEPTDPAASDFDVVLGDEVELNPVLEQYLRSAAHLDIDGASLADMATLTSGFEPYPVYAALARLCEGLSGFTVSPRLLVGTFPHGKLRMVADLAELAAVTEEKAGAERLAGHEVLAALAVSEKVVPIVGHVGPGVAQSPSDLDPDPDPSRERLVLDADSAQGAVVEAVLGGRDVVVHAPPGTGTTQTVANLVAALASQGSTVLLVAQQRSEIQDVGDRLADVGLGSLLLAADSLFDHRGTLRRVVHRLESGHARDGNHQHDGADQEPSNGRSAEGRLRSHRDLLRDHMASLHQIRAPWGVTVYQAQCAIAELGTRSPSPVSAIRIRGAALERLSWERLHELAHELTEAVGVGAWSGGEAEDPWYGARVMSQQDADRAGEIVSRLAGGDFDQRAEALDAILAESSLPKARTVDDWRRTLVTMNGVRDTLEVFRPEIFDIPLDEHVAATGTREERRAQGVELGWWSRSRVRRLATSLLRPGRPPADLHAELVRAQHQRADWHALVGAGGRPEISPRLDEAQDAYDAVDADLTWLGERLAATSAGGDLHRIPIRELRERLVALAARAERLAVLPHVVPVIDDLRAAGMGEVVDDFAARGVRSEEVTAELEHIWWLSIAAQIGEVDPRYGNHDGARLREAVKGFAAADHEHLRAAAQRALEEVSARHVRAVRGNPAQAAMLRAESSRPSRPISLRKAFESSVELLVGIAPCWAISPLSVGEAIPPGEWFDVVIVLGAGTVTSAACVSAMSRGRQVVAIGDPRLGGPRELDTSGHGGGSEAGQPTGQPSLLDDLSSVLPVHRLGWAHAFLDERLVDLANQSTYAGSLVTVPSPVAAAPMRLELVDGRAGVEPGAGATIDTTDAEVERVVELVLEHARTSPQQSLGVVTLTERHADRLRTALTEAVAVRGGGDEDPDALQFLDVASPRPVFIAPMTEATGRTRDVILLSVGYGKTPHGRVLHRFPALSAPGAEQALATALTLARQRLTVVSSIGPDDLDPARLRDQSALLRELLDRARGGMGEVRPPAGALDLLMSNLAERLRREGLVVAEDVGLGPRRIDLAVADAGKDQHWLVAVEADGPRYAAWPGTRERDRLWPDELQRRGWRHVRIWSTDLYRDPAREVARVVAAVRQASRPTGPAGLDLAASTSDDASASEEVSASDDASASEEVSASDETSMSEEVSASGQPNAGGRTSSAGSAPRTPPRKRRRRRASRRGSAAPPDQTSDDTPAGWGERPDDDAHDRWLRDQRPPHWD